MKTVGIVTLTDMYNYGNSLQNYAVKTVLGRLGYDAKTIHISYGGIKVKEVIRSFVKRTPYNKKLLSFLLFEREYLDMTYGKKVDEFNDEFDFFVVGSDQVWNTSWYDQYPFMKDVYLLTSVSDSKKVAFSASFGIDEVKSKYRHVFSTELAKFKALSVREEVGKKIINSLTGKNPTVLLDPTMLLTAEDWIKIEKKPKYAEDGYILTYFLSDKCEKAQEQLDIIKNGRNVYELLNSDDEIVGAAGPSEFIWLINHADLILTDSFHACVFSFLFNKPFIVYDRNGKDCNMNSRLDTLLKKFDLERKYAGSGLENDLWEFDYKNGYKQLEVERQKATDFLRKALES